MVTTSDSIKAYKPGPPCIRCGHSDGLMTVGEGRVRVHFDDDCPTGPAPVGEAVILGADVLDTTGEAPVLGGASLSALEWNAAHGHPSLLVDGSRPVDAHEAIGVLRRAARQVDTKFLRASQAQSGIKSVAGGPVGEVAVGVPYGPLRAKNYVRRGSSRD